MSQSGSIGFALTAGFIVYITVRGELPAYLCVVGIGNGCPTPPATVSSTSSSSSTSSTTNTTSNTTINNPPITTTTINSPPTTGNVNAPSSTTSVGPSSGVFTSFGGIGPDPCDPAFYDSVACNAIMALGSGYTYNGGDSTGTGEGGDNGAGDYE